MKQKILRQLKTLGYKINGREELSEIFIKKCILLNSTDRYKKLFGSLLQINDINHFRSIALEIAFAYDFESNGKSLVYEIKQDESSGSSIDFMYEFADNYKIYFDIIESNMEQLPR